MGTFAQVTKSHLVQIHKCSFQRPYCIRKRSPVDMRKLWVDSSPAPPTTEAPTTTTTLPPTTTTAPSKDYSSIATIYQYRGLAWSSDVERSQWFCSNYHHIDYYNHYHTETDDYHNKHNHDQYHNDYHTPSHYHVQYVVPVLFSFLLFGELGQMRTWYLYWMRSLF